MYLIIIICQIKDTLLNSENFIKLLNWFTHLFYLFIYFLFFEFLQYFPKIDYHQWSYIILRMHA